MSDDRNGKTYSFDVCTQCQISCCQGANPPLTDSRRRILTEYVKNQKTPMANLFVKESYWHPAADAQERCTFLDKETGRCSVHEVKPETCVSGPITFDINLKTGKVEWFLKKSIICAFAGKLYENSEKFSAHLEAAKPHILRLISELDAEALKTILRIAEPETFKVGENELPHEVKQKLGIA